MNEADIEKWISYEPSHERCSFEASEHNCYCHISNPPCNRCEKCWDYLSELEEVE